MQQLLGELESAPETTTTLKAPPARPWRVWAIPVLVYVGLCIQLYPRYQNSFSGDGVAYLRRAGYLAAGDFYNAVSGYWSPLIIALITPFVRAGFDSVYAGHAINAVLGLANVVLLGALIARFTSAPLLVQSGAMLVAALFTVPWSIRYIAPDGLMAALLLCSLLIFSRRRFVHQPSWQFLAGAIGGLAYLAKAYGLPYFVVTMPILIGLLAWRDQRLQTLWRPWLRAIVVTTLGFAVVAVPWMITLSVKYGRPTAALVASRAHAYVGPVMGQEYYPDWGVPPDPFVSHWETPENLRYDFWSPFASRDLFLHQINVVIGNSKRITNFIEEWALGGLAVLILPVALIIVLSGYGMPRRRIELAVLVLALGVYLGGFLPIYVIQRYIIHIGVPLLLAIALLLIYEWKRHADQGASLWRHRIAAVVLVAFGAGGWMQTRDTMYAAGDGLTLRILAEEARSMGLRGLMASNDRSRANGYAFFSEFKHVGFPLTDDPAEADRMLAETGVDILFIYLSPSELREPSLPVRLAQESGRWRLALERGRVQIHVRDKAKPPATMPVWGSAR